jgi:hypothetical protein
MTWSTQHSASGAWALARSQHGVVSRRQLLALGLSSRGIEHRLARGRLHLVARGIYAVGRPTLTPNGRRMAAVLACGGDRDSGRNAPRVVLSHDSAAGLLGIGQESDSAFEISTTLSTDRRVPGVKLHRRPGLRRDSVGYHEGIPVTSPIQTLIDLAARHEQVTVERMVNEADRLRLVRTDDLRRALDDHHGERGVGRLRAILDRRTFRYTRSELERAFLPLARAGGLPLRVPRSTSTATKSTSTSRPSTSWSRPTASPTTAPQPSRPRTANATRITRPRAPTPCVSPTPRSGTNRTVWCAPSEPRRPT